MRDGGEETMMELEVVAVLRRWMRDGQIQQGGLRIRGFGRDLEIRGFGRDLGIRAFGN